MSKKGELTEIVRGKCKSTGVEISFTIDELIDDLCKELEKNKISIKTNDELTLLLQNPFEQGSRLDLTQGIISKIEVLNLDLVKLDTFIDEVVKRLGIQLSLGEKFVHLVSEEVHKAENFLANIGKEEHSSSSSSSSGSSSTSSSSSSMCSEKSGVKVSGEGSSLESESTE